MKSSVEMNSNPKTSHKHSDSMIVYANSDGEITQQDLDSCNIEQARASNRENLDGLGGADSLARKLRVDMSRGLTHAQVLNMRNKFGSNEFPESPMSTFLELFLESFEDTIIIILMFAAIISLAIGMWEHPTTGWIEGTAILIAVLLVALVTSGNNYTKELQFRALEKSSQRDERCSVLRNGVIDRINPIDVVVGDILILQAGDAIPADSILIDDKSSKISCNESSLTGEPEDLAKSKDKDCFLLSSTLVTESDDKIRAMVIGIGLRSQWGKIKANLVSESVNTPLQDKLEDMAGLIGYIGSGVAGGTFLAMVASIWLRHNGENAIHGVLNAFIIAVTIIVVAIPEGLPLAVTISLAYSTKKMYEDQCFIRVLAACETMGNATTLCSDKTGTLTENRMTVVEAMFGDKKYSQIEFETCVLNETVKQAIAENSSVNRTAYLIEKDAQGAVLPRPHIVGNKTEGALMLMVRKWGSDCETIKKTIFQETRDKIFAFNSSKKRSTAVIHRSDGTIRFYVKGAPEWVLSDCTTYLTRDGTMSPMTPAKKAEIEGHIHAMANNARRTLILAHKDYASVSALPHNWMQNVPDNNGLCCDGVVGIIDPLRGDVNDAVAIAQRAGVIVRMVTGDNLQTACAIAKQCGILTPAGLAMEGPVFRSMTPAQVDGILPRLQVLARSSPEDKFLLVTRLNGYGLPSSPEEWAEKHKDKIGATWARDKDRFLPGYREEWEATRPEGGQVVGVTGDGTNDAPALKAADVGLAMGITGTKVAQSASDIVILDDKFSSIVRAIMWGRSVYDNIRKFLQFQLTVNVVALTIVFVGAVAGFDPPLNAVMMLWVNLIMDTMGALALGTEQPSLTLLHRRPYKRTASLISHPMWRNIFCQSAFQVALLLWMLFKGSQFFSVPQGDYCEDYEWVANGEVSADTWDPVSGTRSDSETFSITCATFKQDCPDLSTDCFETYRVDQQSGVSFAYNDLNGFVGSCISCSRYSYVHTTLIFNAFVFCQICNEFNARSLFDDIWVLSGISTNPIFLSVIAITVTLQYLIVTYGGDFSRTSPLTTEQWGITVAMGLVAFPVGFLMRFIPVSEADEDFFIPETSSRASMASSGVAMDTSFSGHETSSHNLIR